jgi:hypothetical protein
LKQLGQPLIEHAQGVVARWIEREFRGERP